MRSYAIRLQEREAHFKELAHTDPLTGLANRRGLLRALAEEVEPGKPCVLLGLDLDGFKNVNDMRGHDVGDDVLVEVGQRLRMNLRPGDVAARLGGDEFAVLMWAKPHEAQGAAERLLGVLNKPYEQQSGRVFLSRQHRRRRRRHRRRRRRPCCSTPTSRCATPSSAARTGSSATTPPTTSCCAGAPRSSTRCAARSSAASCTSRSSPW